MRIFLQVILTLLCLSLITFGQDSPTEVTPKTPTYSESKSYRPKRTQKPYKFKKKKKKKKKGKISIGKPNKDIVKIPISAFDEKGKFLTDLKQDEIELFQDGIKQEILSFGISKEPSNIVLILDVSPSADLVFEEVKKSALAFVEKMSVKNNVIIARLDDEIKIIGDTRKDKNKALKSIRKLKMGSGTSIYDGIGKFISEYSDEVEGQQVFVLFSDAVDTTSRRFSYQTSINAAETSNAIFLGIYFNTWQAKYANRRVKSLPRTIIPTDQLLTIIGSTGYRRLKGTTGNEYALGFQYFNELVASTGGRLLDLGNEKEKIGEAFHIIEEVINRQYFIEFKTDPKNIGHKQLKVRVNRPNLIIRIRDNYFVGN